MTINQVSVFLENESGRLAEATAALDAHAIDIRALSIADTTSFGVLRLIVSEPDKAAQVLRDAGFTVNQTKVVAVKLEDVPGALNSVLQVLKATNVNVEYVYAFIARKQDAAYVILRVEKPDEAAASLQNAGFTLIPAAALYNL